MICKNCKDKFEPRQFNRKYCTKDECNNLYFEELKGKAIKKAQKEKREYNKETKKNSKSYLQDEINKLARMIDERYGFNTCIDCGNIMDSVHGAHLHNVNGNENIRYNLNNIHSARGYCNKWSSEHKVGYRDGLEKRYGKEYRDYVVNDMKIQYSYIGLNSLEINLALKKTREIIRNFNKYSYNGDGARDYFNELIGIYKKV